MGGCRCYFKECNVATGNSPGTHFFHFPLRDHERCIKWAFYSDNMSFLKLPHDKLRNKVICTKHFKLDCFMNYKKNSLVKTAIPTLLISATTGDIHDLETENNLLVLTKITKELLQQDKLEKPLLLNSTNIILPSNDTILDDEKFNFNIQIYQVDKTQSQSSQQQLHCRQQSNKHSELQLNKPKILNKELKLTKVKFTDQVKIDDKITYCLDEATDDFLHKCPLKRVKTNLPEVKLLNKKLIRKFHQNSVDTSYSDNTSHPNVIKKPIMLSNKLINVNHTEESMIELNIQPIIISNENEINIQSAETSIIECQSNTNSIEEIKEGDTNLNEIMQQQIENIFVPKENTILNNQVLNPIIENIENNVSIIQESNSNVSGDKQILSIILPEEQQEQTIENNEIMMKEQNSNMVITLKQKETKPEKTKPLNLTKLQLFNGISKYLNPSMISLLRMDLFSTPEREYETDEKNFARELYEFNSETYEFLRDEWRIRLPSKKDVEQWIKDYNDSD